MRFNDDIGLNLNEYQTQLTDKYVEDLPTELYMDLVEYINSIPFIRSLITSDMPLTKDLDKDEEGKVIVSITKPHRLENMDFFRPAALHYQKYGKYTLLTPNPHPKSPYKLFWKEEIRRCIEGYVRPSDAEWIPGDLYFYWNYCPIMITKQVNKSRKAIRTLDFPKPWLGDYLFFHYKDQAEQAGQHIAVVKMRGVGASFKAASFGVKRAVLTKNQKTFYTAYDKQFLNQDGVLNKSWKYLDFLAENTPFPRMRLKDSLNRMELRLGYKDLDTGAETGTKGEIIGISSKDDPDKIRGKRGTIYFEEFGKFPKLSDTWNVCRDSTEDGEVAYDMLIAMGTGGTEGADFSGAQDMIYNPDSYNIYSLDNVFDKNSSGKVIFHWGSYLNRNLCYDENGMPDAIKALLEVLFEFDRLRKASSDGKSLTQRRAEKCITIADAIMRVDGTIFPVADLKDCLDTALSKGESFRETHYVGELIVSSTGSIKWKNNRDKKPLRKYKFEDRYKEGAIEIFDMPQKDSDGVIANRYIISTDPVDDDIGTSLTSTWVFDTWTQSIVAEYTGRPNFVNDYYEIVRRLAVFYNASIMYENNKKGLFAYFDQHNCTHLLADAPQILVDKEMLKSAGYGNKSKGVHATQDVNNYARSRIREWLLKEAHYTFQEFKGEEQLTHKQNMHTIKSTALLEELIMWNKDGNFDRVSGLGMVMIYNEEKKKYLQSYKDKKKEPQNDFTDSDYFSNNFDNRFSYNTVDEMI